MALLTIGLTGGVASGKTLVAQFFIELGVPLLDADHVARAVVEPGSAGLAEIVATFGPEVLTASGALDRRALRQRVFAMPSARHQLEQITHPRIREEMQRWHQAQSAPYCILSIPLLVEGGTHPLVHRVLLVDAPEALQLQRLMQRDEIDEPLARRMIAAQASREQRRAAADDILVNDGSPQQVRARVHELHLKYLHLSRNPSA